jgi:hypothetical protein
MGAISFCDKVTGNSAQEAFDWAVADAAYDYGQTGYTGTIAEKDDFIMCDPVPEGLTPEEYYDVLSEDQDHFSDDKWGPAACIDCSNGYYMFFGWASS